MLTELRSHIQSRWFLAVLLLIGAPFFFWGGPGYYSSRSFQAAWDLGHILYFLVLTCWLHQWLRARKGGAASFSEFFLIFFLGVLLGVAVEFLQMLGGNRSPDMEDVLRNQLGCLIAYAFLIRPLVWASLRQRRLMQIGVSLALLVAVWPLFRAVIDEYRAGQQFPVLADFETSFERYRWNSSNQLREESTIVRHGNKAVQVQLSTNKFSGIALFYFPRDWRGFQGLRFSVYNPKKTPLLLNGRIHDVHHKKHEMEFGDRYNQQFVLAPGWNDLAIPLDKVKAAPKGRVMDMENIEGFGLFVIQQPHPQVIYLDNVYLSK